MTRAQLEAAIRLYDDAAFVLVVTCAAMSPLPFLALGVAAAYLIGRAVVADRRMPEPEK